MGGAGNDVLVGGFGCDRLVRSTGHDVLAAGTILGDYFALRELGDSWASGFDPDTASADDGATSEVLDESTGEQLTGASGHDWFIIVAGDAGTDLGKVKSPTNSGWFGDDYVTVIPAD